MNNLHPAILVLLSSFAFGCGEQVVGWRLDDTGDTDTDTDPDTSDRAPPFVTATTPLDGATEVRSNEAITATFNELMDPLSLTTGTFLLQDGSITIEGDVGLTDLVASFDPITALEPDTLYTATITTGAMDVSGNALEDDYVWTFTTRALVDTIPPTVVFTVPDDLATDVALDALVTVTFSEPMDAMTLNTATFDVVGFDPVTGTVSNDLSTWSATFAPSEDLLPGTTYTATITTGATDVAGNELVEDYLWTFTTSEEEPWALLPVDLGSLVDFVAVAGAGLTNSNSSGTTTLTGDVGLYPTATCLGDGSPCTLTNPVINGTLYANDAAGIAALAKTDLTAAYVDAMSRPVGTIVNDISGMTLPPGVYTSGSTMSVAVGSTVVLDGGGDKNSVWIFQIGSSLTVNNDAKVLLVNGAKANNVFWAAFASSTLGSDVSFQGNILAGASNSLGTDSVVVGRLLCTTGQITLLSNTATLPAP